MDQVFINDRFVPSSEAALGIRDLAIARGYGVFDFLKVAEGQPLFLHAHLDRLYGSSEALHLKIPVARPELEQIIDELLFRNNMRSCGIRITVTGGFSPDGYHPVRPNLIMSCHEVHLPGEADIERGISLQSWPFRRQFPEVKTIDYLMAVWLLPRLKEWGADDVLYHHEGLVSECPRANIFMVDKNNRIFTPASHVLKGITRKNILSFSSQDFNIMEKDFTLNELYEAREIFICSTTKNILPVKKMDGRDLPRKNPVTLELLALLKQLQQRTTVSSTISEQ